MTLHSQPPQRRFETNPVLPTVRTTPGPETSCCSIGDDSEALTETRSAVRLVRFDGGNRIPTTEERSSAWAAIKANPVPYETRMESFVDAVVGDIGEVFPEPENLARHIKR